MLPISVKGSDYQKVNKEGFLFKYSSTRGESNLRYFFLDVTLRRMYYCADREACVRFRATGKLEHIKGTIDLHNSVVYPYVDYLTDEKTAESNKFSFEITTPERPLLLSARSASELQDWVAALCYSCGVTLLTPDAEVYVQGASIGKVRRGKYGYMEKRGRRFTSGYKRRFFRTIEAASGQMVLAYYNTHYDVHPVGEVVVIAGATIHDGDLEEDRNAPVLTKVPIPGSPAPASSAAAAAAAGGGEGRDASPAGPSPPGSPQSSSASPLSSPRGSLNRAQARGKGESKKGQCCVSVRIAGRDLSLKCPSSRLRFEWIEILLALSRDPKLHVPEVIDLFERQDLYALLQVTSDASSEAISSAYQRLIASDLSADMKRVMREAYDVLMDPIKRPVYDDLRRIGMTDPADVEDLRNEVAAARAAGAAGSGSEGQGEDGDVDVDVLDYTGDTELVASATRPTLHLQRLSVAWRESRARNEQISPVTVINRAVDKELRRRAQLAIIAKANAKGASRAAAGAGADDDEDSDVYKDDDEGDACAQPAAAAPAAAAPAAAAPAAAAPAAAPAPAAAVAVAGGVPAAAPAAAAGAAGKASVAVPESKQPVPAAAAAAAVAAPVAVAAAAAGAAAAAVGPGAKAAAAAKAEVEDDDSSISSIDEDGKSHQRAPAAAAGTGAQLTAGKGGSDPLSVARAQWAPEQVTASDGLIKGMTVHKIARGIMIGDRAKPTVIRLRFTPADGAWAVTWDSNKDAKDACFPLVKGEVDVKPGHDQGAFKEHSSVRDRFNAKRCFSLVRLGKGSGRESLDIACDTVTQANEWAYVLRRILS